MYDDKINSILEVLTLEEKVSLLIGEDHWRIKAIPKTDLKVVVFSDGPNGLRKEISTKKQAFMAQSEKAVCYPSLALLGSSFNRDLIYQVGKMIAKEARDQSVDVLLAPVANLKRNPLCGRNFEYFSEDPFLSSECAINYINGVQSEDVMACLKHFILNNNENNRMVSNSIIDDRSLHEVYLNQFKRTITKAKPAALMTSYNKVNGSYVCESDLLKKEIREKLNYKGLVMTDWQAMNDRVASYKHGLDLEMPGGFKPTQIIKAVKNKTLDEKVIDEAACRIIHTAIQADKNRKQSEFNVLEARKLAKIAAIESFVLLKNNGVLPFKTDKQIALIGKLAKKPRYQGAGSSRVNPREVVSLYDEFIRNGKRFEYAYGYEETTEAVDESLIEEAVTKSRNKSLVVVVLGLYEKEESEGFDRTHLNLPINQLKLMERLIAECKNIVCVIETGSSVLLPFEAGVDAIMLSYFSGEMGDAGLYDVLTGKFSPSGRLQETFLYDLNDLESTKYFNQGINSYYKEGIYVGYKDLLSLGKESHYPFGFGCSYAKFGYQYVGVDKDIEKLTFRVLVTNTSNIDSKEVIQIYMGKKDSKIYRETYRLVGFNKQMVRQKTTVEFQIDVLLDDLMCYMTTTKQMCLEEGSYEFYIGTSSSNHFKEVSINLAGHSFDQNPNTYPIQMNTKEYLTYFSQPIVENNITSKYHANTTFEDISDRLLGKVLLYVAIKKIKKTSKDDLTVHMMTKAMKAMPLRSLESSTNGFFNQNRVSGLVLMLNRKRMLGLIKIIKG